MPENFGTPSGEHGFGRRMPNNLGSP
jgi:hypothetical protein